MSGVLIPWEIQDQHRGLFVATMLRAYARRTAGRALSPRLDVQLDAFLRRLVDDGLVVDYDPESGFVFVPRRAGIDKGIVREASS